MAFTYGRQNLRFTDIMEKDCLKTTQERLSEMLEELDLFCRKNSINYTLGFGSVLGAFRHQGFIP